MRQFLSLFFLIINVMVVAQTQYDYYDDSVAHQNPDLNIFGLIMLLVIGFVVWFIYASIKERINKQNANTPATKAPKTKSSLDIMKEKAEQSRRQRELAWEADIKEKLRVEAIEILKNEYCEPHILDGVRYVLKYETLGEDGIKAFVRGYTWGSFRRYSFLSIDKFKKSYHPIVVLGYLRGLQEEKEIWERFGKFPG